MPVTDYDGPPYTVGLVPVKVALGLYNMKLNRQGPLLVQREFLDDKGGRITGKRISFQTERVFIVFSVPINVSHLPD